MEEDSTWKEMERRVSKNGYRDGAADGHKSTFQAGFDEGFKEGVRLGQTIGFQKGLSAINPSPYPDDMLNKSNCQACEDPKLLDGDYKTLKEVQSISNTIIETNIKLSI